MYAMHDGGGISQDDISIEQQRVDAVLDTLRRAQGKVLKGANLARVPSASFGAAATATELETHAGKAHGHIVDAMTQTIGGLKSYGRALDRFLVDVEERDAEQQQRLLAIQEGVTCVAQPTFQSNTSCTVPAEGDR
jgi:hypothetical protein